MLRKWDYPSNIERKAVEDVLEQAKLQAANLCNYKIYFLD